MNRKDNQIAQEFPKKELDAVINKHFEKEGIVAESHFDFFGSFSYTTNFETDDPMLRQRVNEYIQGFMDGWVALREKLNNKEY